MPIPEVLNLKIRAQLSSDIANFCDLSSNLNSTYRIITVFCHSFSSPIEAPPPYFIDQEPILERGSTSKMLTLWGTATFIMGGLSGQISPRRPPPESLNESGKKLTVWEARERATPCSCFQRRTDLGRTWRGLPSLSMSHELYMYTLYVCIASIYMEDWVLWVSSGSYSIPLIIWGTCIVVDNGVSWSFLNLPQIIQVCNGSDSAAALHNTGSLRALCQWRCTSH